ncbi:asparaginase [Petroclostridium sp. X23]|uniref:asparaginase n=1 Tax=Petroclostridium sp. X23 TaxID=3045146 RepID=UPI0024AD53BD|nr:asparaginase [Petroclostridium sp. X23]WHH58866.1 asparaginase [Petroclostridium sp. X23]
MKKILLVATGGTIASSESEHGLSPSFDAEGLLALVPEIKDICDISGKLIMNIDSTNMSPNMMIKIAQTIYENYHEYDGFVVTHGTDTMGYTSAALSYMLQNIKKTVVVTGSQIAIGALYTDAKKNISDAIRFAIEGMPGIFVAFDGKIINGTRAKKIRTRSMNAFESINSPYVAEIKLGKVTFNKDIHEIIKVDASKPFKLQTSLCTDIMVIKLFTGIKPDIFDFVKNHYKGVIIESFGIGGIPSQEYNIVEKVKELIESGVVVVITTQCLEEGIDLGIYEVGQELAKNAVICAGDMNIEAIIAKLMWALGNFENMDDIKYFIETPVLGDISA